MQVLIALTLPTILALPLGWSMARVMDRPAARRGRGLDALPLMICRLFGSRGDAAVGWRGYAAAMLAFNAALFVATFAILWLQPWLPLNPDRKGPLAGDLIFNIVCSFVTNCSLQHYAGEQHLSYASQIGVIAFLDFVSTATRRNLVMSLATLALGLALFGLFHALVVGCDHL
jgi:K+-transporting ATPase ATPase A chain